MNSKQKEPEVTVVTVVFGNRWNFLIQSLNSLVNEEKIKTIIIVDNNSENAVDMDVYANKHLGKIIILRQSENLGFSGAISKGLVYSRDTEADYVLVMDDDCVLETGGVDMFLDIYKYFKDKKVVLCANRVDVPGYDTVFNRPPIITTSTHGTLFEVFSFKKISNFLKFIFNIKKGKLSPFIPILPIQGFVTGGSFIPMQAVRSVDVPDPGLFIYCEDLDYSWRMNKAGYVSYLCSRPIIRDLDMTFAKEGDHIWGLFKSDTPDYKVYYRMRNSVIISRKHTIQSKFTLLLNVISWYLGLIILGFFKHSSWQTYASRVRIICHAVLDGYRYPKTTRPTYIKIPD